MILWHDVGIRGAELGPSYLYLQFRENSRIEIGRQSY